MTINNYGCIIGCQRTGRPMPHAAVAHDRETRLRFADILLNTVALLLLTLSWSLLIVGPISGIGVLVFTVLTLDIRTGAPLVLISVVAALLGLLLLYVAKKLSERRLWGILLCAVSALVIGAALLHAGASDPFSNTGTITWGVLALLVGIFLCILSFRSRWQSENE